MDRVRAMIAGDAAHQAVVQGPAGELFQVNAGGVLLFAPTYLPINSLQAASIVAFIA